MTRFRESYGRLHDSGPGRAVRFRTRPHGARAGDGGYSGHAGREVVRHHDGEKEQHVQVHRLALFAWSPDMDIEDLWLDPPDARTADPRTGKREVHHEIPIPWLNTEDNLSWKSDEEHSRIEAQRKLRDRRGRFSGPAPYTEADD